jgi:hypothetical protein
LWHDDGTPNDYNDRIPNDYNDYNDRIPTDQPHSTH